MATIRVEHLSKKFPSHTALADVSFTVPEHVRCVGFLGPNGSGKTTVIKIMTGLLTPTSGTVEVAGVNVLEKPHLLREKIGYVEQHPALINWMNGHEFLMFVGRLFKLSKAECRARATELLAKVGLTEAGNRRISGYSGGMKKRLGIAQGLMGKPKVVFLDEPVAEMDPVGRVEILQLIEELKQEVTIFMSTHILEDIERTADQIIILNKGHVESISTLDQLKAQHQTTHLLIEVGARQDQLLQELVDPAFGILSVQEQKGRLLITPHDPDAFAEKLQAHLQSNHYTLKHYEWVVPSLEEIFMKVVNAS